MRLWMTILSDIRRNINCLLYCIVLYHMIKRIQALLPFDINSRSTNRYWILWFVSVGDVLIKCTNSNLVLLFTLWFPAHCCRNIMLYCLLSSTRWSSLTDLFSLNTNITMTMTMTMIKKIIVSSGFNIFNTFINLYDQGFILNHRRPYITCTLHTICYYSHIISKMYRNGSSVLSFAPSSVFTLYHYSTNCGHSQIFNSFNCVPFSYSHTLESHCSTY